LIKINDRIWFKDLIVLDAALWREPSSARLVRAISADCPDGEEVDWGATQ
jgi:uncharacterized protein YbaA (DUF1428 family)